MIPTAEHIARVGTKVARLIKAYKNLQKDHERLSIELENKTAAEARLREQTKLMEQQLNLLKATSGHLDEEAKKDLQKQLNHYIKEIDRCISMLGE
jgi:phage host-nuclease inhibitor protein Gam